MPLQSTGQRFIDIIVFFCDFVRLNTSKTSNNNFLGKRLLFVISRCYYYPQTLSASISINFQLNWLKFGLLADYCVYFSTLDLDQRLDESSATVNLIKWRLSTQYNIVLSYHLNSTCCCCCCMCSIHLKRSGYLHWYCYKCRF